MTITTPMTMRMSSTPIRTDRRGLLGLIGCASLTAVLPWRPAHALDADGAHALIDRSLAEVYQVINSGQPAPQMYQQFEAIFARYADVDVIARSALGPAARWLMTRSPKPPVWPISGRSSPCIATSTTP